MTGGDESKSLSAYFSKPVQHSVEGRLNGGGAADEDMKGAALFGSERFPLMGFCTIFFFLFYIIFCVHEGLISFLLLQSPSGDQLSRSFDEFQEGTQKEIICELFHFCSR